MIIIIIINITVIIIFGKLRKLLYLEKHTCQNVAAMATSCSGHIYLSY